MKSQDDMVAELAQDAGSPTSVPLPRGPLQVAAVQLTSTRDVDSNLKRAAHWVEKAAAAGAQWVALPENFGFLGEEAEALEHAQPVDGGYFTEELRRQAERLRIYILAGSIPEHGEEPGMIYNTSVLIGRHGETVATYRKIHLFDVDLAGQVRLRESAHVSPGTRTVVAEIDGWRIGLSICYDLRFPELYRHMVGEGAQILSIPAAFTLQTGKDHWEVLLRARAIENQCFVVAPAQFGRHGERRISWGKSMIVDPWGTCLAVAPEREGFVMATLEYDDLDRPRRELPCLRHRKPIR